MLGFATSSHRGTFVFVWLLHPHNLLNHAFRLAQVASSKQHVMINDMVQIVDNATLFVTL